MSSSSDRRCSFKFTVILALIFVVPLVSTQSVSDLTDRCISSKLHKKKPGPEGKAFAEYHCTPWNMHSCCTWNTSSKIDQDGTLSLYGITWDQCPKNKKMSQKCRQHFQKDTCFYECSPNLGPWIQVDKKPTIARKERMLNVPLCAQDCIDWYHDCMYDFTCNDNWGKNWNWSQKGTAKMCTKQCKLFKEYFPDPKTFCEKIFNYSFKYETDTSKCMNMVPQGNKNYNVSVKQAEELTTTKKNMKNVSAVKSTSNFFLFIYAILYVIYTCRDSGAFF